ncbi:MAG: ISAs1 family transposase, partial [Legionellaceae bacterium]|nr:ISAs1 family transposase [Legionellaceae bacterium]
FKELVYYSLIKQQKWLQILLIGIKLYLTVWVNHTGNFIHEFAAEYGIEDFGHCKLDWLRKFLPYENGIPRHDTVARLMACLSPKSLQSCFVSWVQSIAKITDGEIVAIDGKQARRSYDKKSRKAAIHMVSAWACQNGVVLGQQKTDAKSNEITSIPQLLDILELKGCIVTIDAMGCQRDIAKKIRECEKDFRKDWVDLKSLACIISSRDVNNVITQEARYYVSSLRLMQLKLVMQSDVIGMLKIRCIGLWMLRLRKMTQELGAGSLQKT